MTTPPKLSRKEALVIEILTDPNGRTRLHGEVYGLDIIAASRGRLKRGTVYVTLHAMEERGLIASRLEDRGEDWSVHIPTRRLYQAAPLGAEALRARPAPTRRTRILRVVYDLYEAYGLQVADQLIASGAATWWDRLVHPWVHPDLRHLERADLLVSRESPPLPERGGRPRFYYRLTEKGQAIVAGARWEDVS